ncbi:cyclic GMP-AMP synthase-like [Hydractinia symbiolongicarpus]|uniref:cyclic GMP-AMP synthase-like n=1 Tax=Hydractinia symbiolongicarpus TaxID=13093 RepID=UPI00254C0E06|nr:cyclic GMP-AMP synthase-like [Hydractinia symbiolongicarpus]XP_057297455.1 cyclic GMP-AMP synthase-like [Hydractinia symbiolongicarpus]XP_057297456.1 cyclic GMP-AMP synthase-like [Hydractinia symbiolongicarpus]
MYFKCKLSSCKKKFQTELHRIYHEEDDHEIIKPKKCKICKKQFERKSTFIRHQQLEHETNHLVEFLEERYRGIIVEPASRKIARREVQKVFDELGKYFGDGIFSNNFRKSGSYSTDTKVLHADEFDFDVPLRFCLEKLHLNREGKKVFYHFTQRQKTLNLNVPMKVVDTRSWEGIPQGYVEVVTEDGEKIVPRIIQEELYTNLLCAIKNVDGIVDVLKEPKGPALTVKIKKPGLPHITVDLSASISTNQVTLSDYKWPREKTKIGLTKKLIKSINDAGLHLIPKNPKFWYISVSRTGQALMNGIDSNDNGCRKKCHKLLKADFQTWLGRSSNNLPGISTMIFKHQLFWFNEDNPKLDWSPTKTAERYLDMLEDLGKRLRSGILYNYFKDYENILQDRDLQVLNQLANLVDARRQELAMMG